MSAERFLDANGNVVVVTRTNPLPVLDEQSQSNTASIAENTGGIYSKLSNNTASGNITTANANGNVGIGTTNSFVEIAIGDVSAAAIQVLGTVAGTLAFQATVDGTNWINIGVLPIGSGNTPVPVSTTTSTGQWELAGGSYQKIRVVATSWTSGTANIYLTATPGIRVVRVTNGVSIGGMVDAAQSVTFTRPNNTTAYTANQVVNNATSGAANRSISNVARGVGTSGYLNLIITCGNTSVTPRFRLHLYDSAPATAKNDATTWAFDRANDDSKYLGYVDFDAMNGGVAMASKLAVYKAAAASRDIFFELQTLDSFTPAAQTGYTIKLIPDQNNV